jgi:hypothetical protein
VECPAALTVLSEPVERTANRERDVYGQNAQCVPPGLVRLLVEASVKFALVFEIYLFSHMHEFRAFAT